MGLLITITLIVGIITLLSVAMLHTRLNDLEDRMKLAPLEFEEVSHQPFKEFTKEDIRAVTSEETLFN